MNAPITRPATKRPGPRTGLCVAVTCAALVAPPFLIGGVLALAGVALGALRLRRDGPDFSGAFALAGSLVALATNLLVTIPVVLDRG